MFGISFEHLVILFVVGLFILGPQRLPEAAAWLGRTTRMVRHYIGGAREQIRAELGPDYDELRNTMGTLNTLRRPNPMSTTTSSLLNFTTTPHAGPAPSPMVPAPTPSVEAEADSATPAEPAPASAHHTDSTPG